MNTLSSPRRERDLHLMGLAFTVNSLILYLGHFELTFILIEGVLFFFVCLYVSIAVHLLKRLFLPDWIVLAPLKEQLKVFETRSLLVAQAGLEFDPHQAPVCWDHRCVSPTTPDMDSEILVNFLSLYSNRFCYYIFMHTYICIHLCGGACVA